MKLCGAQRERHPEERTLAIEAGKVLCPRGVIVDIETCWICPSYRGLSSDRIEGLICRAERFTVPQAAIPIDGMLPGRTTGK